MKLKRADLAIINRSFWPIYPVIGEALLRFAEKNAGTKDICVILQDHVNIFSKLKKYERGQGVKFYPCKAWSTSASSILYRISDAIFFMFWVMAALIWTRPRKVYVSTDPPVLVPFIVMIYSKIFRAEYIYHLQDIHPEATNVVIPVNKLVYRTLFWLDCLTMRNASLIITITDEMGNEIRKRSATTTLISVVSNPAVSFDKVIMPSKKKAGFTFCGNAGRLQRLPLLIDAISKYYEQQGSLPFVFAGGGIYTEELKSLAQKFPAVTYLGLISADEAAQVNADFQWALLPIEDEVTRFAFPSKSSSYVFSGALVAAISGQNTSVSAWVHKHNLGVVISPDAVSLVEFFKKVESGDFDSEQFNLDRTALKKNLEFDFFIEKLNALIIAKDVGDA